MARANLIFGLHVHVGIKDKPVAMALANQVRYFLPHLLSLTCSSPFWMGRKTGLDEHPQQHLQAVPPHRASPMSSRATSSSRTSSSSSSRTHCIDNGKKLWWDVRPHYMFDTVEVRICDMPTNLEDTLAVVALVQALMAKLYLMYRRNTGWRTYSRAAHRGEQVAGPALRHRRQDHRLRHERGASFQGAGQGARGVRLRGHGCLRHPRPHEAHPSDRRGRHQRPPPAGDLREEQGRAEAVVDWIIEETMRGV